MGVETLSLQGVKWRAEWGQGVTAGARRGPFGHRDAGWNWQLLRGKKLKEVPGDQKVSSGQWISLVCRGEHKFSFHRVTQNHLHGIQGRRFQLWGKAWATQSCFTLVCATNTAEHISIIISHLSGFKFPCFNTSNMTLIWGNFLPAARIHL